MNLFGWSGLILGATIFPLGVFVFLQNKGSKANRMLALFCFAGALWGFGGLKISLIPMGQAELATVWWRITHIGVILMPVFLLHFIFEFLGLKKKKFLLFIYGLAIFFLLVNFFTNSFIANMRWVFNSFYWDSPPGLLYYPFVAFFFGCVIYAHYELYRMSRSFIGLKKTQTMYIFMAALLGFSGGGTAFLPVFGVNFYPFLNFATPLYPFIITYAIIKKQLFGIRVILTQLLVGAIGILLLIQIFLSKSILEYIWKGGLFLLFVFFGYLLIKSVLDEIRYKEQLQKAYEDLKVLDKAKSEFISMASHQLRTPLSAIKGYISMLIDGSYGRLPGKAKNKLVNVFQSNERLVRIINDLLDISKIEMGKMELETQPTQLEDLLKSCYEEMKVNAEKKKLKFAFQKPESVLPKIELDPLKFRQIILNLIDNAIRYTKKGEIDLKVEKVGSGIRISIKDTGEGMIMEEQRNIFEGFTRGQAGITHFIEGAGLGLYTAKKFLELHKGKIWVESEGRGKGSTFFVELPVK